MSAPSNAVQIQGQGSVNADAMNTWVQWTTSVATARGFIGLTGMVIVVEGTAAPGDGGQGLFYWNANGTAADDNGVTTIVPTGAGSGEWTRLPTVTTIASLFWAGLATGIGNAQAVTSTSFTTTNGQTLQFLSAGTNTAGVTLNPNATSNYVVYKNSQGGVVALTGGELVGGDLYFATWVQTLGGFLLINPTVNLFGVTTNLAGASTTDLGTVASHNVNITGNPTITSFGSSASTLSPMYRFTLATGATLTNSASLIVPGGTQAFPTNTCGWANYLGAGVWQVTDLTLGNGNPISPNSVFPAFSGTALQQLVSNGTTAAWSKNSVVFARASFSTGSAPTIDTGAINIATITRNSTGNYTVAFTVAPATANYQVVMTAAGSGYICQCAKATKTTANFVFTTSNTSALADFTNCDVVVYGGF